MNHLVLPASCSHILRMKIAFFQKAKQDNWRGAFFDLQDFVYTLFAHKHSVVNMIHSLQFRLVQSLESSKRSSSDSKLTVKSL